MPVVTPPVKGTPLTQGDILGAVPFATTTSDGKLSVDPNASYVLVVSRPCKALRDEQVAVAAVHPSKIDLGRIATKTATAEDGSETLDRMRRVLAGIRDGGQLTDSFYLGPIESGHNGRFAADLSALSTQRVPTDGTRQAWVDEHRVASLDPEFSRDLHVRLFNVFARLGFDDHRWLSDADLDVIINAGQQEHNALQQKALEAESAIHKQEAAGRPVPEKQRSDLAAARAKAESALAALAPYLGERARRIK